MDEAEGKGEPLERFIARGGLWVIAQVPVLLLAVLLPVYAGQEFRLVSGVAMWVGGSLVALGLGLSVMGLADLGDALTPFPAPRADGSLHTSGLYRWMRHPIYAGLIIGALGWALAWQRLPGVLYVLLVFVFFDRKAAYEETRLSARYEGYAAYRARVRKFFPGLY